MVGKVPIAAAVAVLIVIVAAVMLLGGQPAAAHNVMAIQLTDPPQVPNGTTALVIAYSSVAVQVGGVASSGWLSANGTGSVDLMKVINLKQTIGTIAMPQNATVEMVRFNVTSAQITVNGTTYNVTVPSGQITAHISGGLSVNGNESILMDLSPTVATIITSNSTLFVLVPSIRAVLVPGASNSTTRSIGARVQLHGNDTAELEAHTPNISVSNAALSVVGNSTHLSLTVTDNSNSSVSLQHLDLSGNLTVSFNATAAQQSAHSMLVNLASNLSSFCTAVNASGNATANAIVKERTNISSEAHIEANASNGSGAFQKFNASNIDRAANASIASSSEFEAEGHAFGDISVEINASACTHAGLSNITAKIEDRIANFSRRIENEQMGFRFITFAISDNGTLVVPSSETSLFENSNLTLQSRQSVTLQFSGPLTFADNHFLFAVQPGSTYKVTVQGEEGARASANVTATQG